MSDVLELTQDQFENTIAENKVVVVDFGRLGVVLVELWLQQLILWLKNLKIK